MAITALPPAPSRSDPSNFASEADAWVAALDTFTSEANALQADVNAKQVTASAAATSASASAIVASQTVDVAAWVSGTTYALGVNVYDTTDFLTYRRKVAGAGTTRPGLDSTNWQLLTGLGDVTLTGTQTLTNKTINLSDNTLTTTLAQLNTAVSDADVASQAGIQSQTYTAFTTTGTAPNFALTPTPAITSYVAGQRFRIKSHAGGTTGSNTLNVSALGVKSLKQYDSTGAKVAGVVAAGLFDVEYDGTDFVILDPLPLSASTTQKGVVQLATAGVAQAGTDPAQVLTPSTMKAAQIQLGTYVASASGTAVDFIGIPSWAKRIIVMLNGVSTNGTSLVQIQLGSGSFTATGYTSTVTSSTTVTGTAGFVVSTNNAAVDSRSGVVVLTNITGNSWTEFGVVAASASAASSSCGVVGIPGAVDRVRITTANGTDAFDGGGINISWE